MPAPVVGIYIAMTRSESKSLFRPYLVIMFSVNGYIGGILYLHGRTVGFNVKARHFHSVDTADDHAGAGISYHHVLYLEITHGQPVQSVENGRTASAPTRDLR